MSLPSIMVRLHPSIDVPMHPRLCSADRVSCRSKTAWCGRDVPCSWNRAVLPSTSEKLLGHRAISQRFLPTRMSGIPTPILAENAWHGALRLSGSTSHKYALRRPLRHTRQGLCRRRSSHAFEALATTWTPAPKNLLPVNRFVRCATIPTARGPISVARSVDCRPVKCDLSKTCLLERSMA